MSFDETVFETLDGLFEALYSSISGPPGGQDFELSRRIHHPDARLVRTRLDEQGMPIALSFSVDEYEANVRGLLADMHFHEIETDRRTVRFGNVAQAFSAYEARTAPNGGELIKRGLNFAHLYHDGARWWLMHLIWDDEREGVTIPREIFDQWRDIGTR
ncbi:MAG: hypothetical protein ACXW2T_04860 [Allosphingosinicella sp.]